MTQSVLQCLSTNPILVGWLVVGISVVLTRYQDGVEAFLAS